MVTIYDIAKKANVSAMTVSKVINNTGRISEPTREKIRRVMEELNYVPNSTARSLVLQQTNTLFLLITDITNPFYTTLARGAEDAARESGYKLLFGNSDENPEKEQEYIDTILATRADGVLMAPAGDSSCDHLKLLQKHKIPFVLLDREVPGIEADTVLGDSREGARLLVQHLIDLGHRRIALVNGPHDISSARERYNGYRDALKQNGIPCDPTLFLEVSYQSKQDGTIEDWLCSTLAEKPTAIFAGNNFLALSLIRLLHNKGLDVPRDISIVCFDELEPGLVVHPFLTVAAQQSYQFGFLGARMLIDRIRDGSLPPKKIILPTEIVIRESAGELKTKDNH